MCGIAGIINLDGTAVDPKSLDRLTDALAHRGPDGRGTFIEGGVGFGHRRLSILDLSNAAAQPMRSVSGNAVVTFNGEIYNFQELREELKFRGRKFASTGDTEVLLQAYEEYGEDFLQKLRGMFALAIYDKKKRTVLLARDRVGKKPLKYFHAGNTFAFASELKALRTLPRCPGGADGEAIHHFLTMMYVPAPGTGIKGIKKLPAGHVLSIDLKTGTGDVRPYWALRYSTNKTRSLKGWQSDVRDVFTESVRLRMIADVPVGAFLSGGIDSAAVVATMAQLSTKPVETFTIGSTQETHNELPLAALIAERFGTNHHPITVEPDIVHLLPELVRTYEEPFADPSVIPTYLVARETRKVVTVALNGDGGDENFAGYARYPILKFSRLWKLIPPPLRQGVTLLMGVLHAIKHDTFSYRCLRFQESIGDSEARRQLQYLSFFTEDEKRRLMKPGTSFPDTFAWYEKLTKEARSRGDHWLHRDLSADIATYLADDLLPKVDMGSMAHALETRSPLLDHVLLELTATMPADLKLKGFSTKWIFKQMLRGLVPDDILDRRKTGFRLPLDHWFRTDLKPFVLDRLLAPSSPLWTMFSREAVEAFLADYYASRIDLSDHVWALLWLDEWMRQYT